MSETDSKLDHPVFDHSHALLAPPTPSSSSSETVQDALPPQTAQTDSTTTTITPTITNPGTVTAITTPELSSLSYSSAPHNQSGSQPTKKTPSANIAPSSGGGVGDWFGGLSSMWNSFSAVATGVEQDGHDVNAHTETIGNVDQYLNKKNDNDDENENENENTIAAIAGQAPPLGLDFNKLDFNQFWNSINQYGESVKKSIDPNTLQQLRQHGDTALKDASEMLKNLENIKVTDLIDQGKKNVRTVFESEQEEAIKYPVAPWDNLSEEEQKYAEPLREQVMKLVLDCVYNRDLRQKYFLSNVAANKNFVFDYQSDGHIAVGALKADQNLKRLRAGLVPRLVQEQVFWDNYFYHVRRILNALITDGPLGIQENRQANSTDNNHSASLEFSDDDDDNSNGAAKLDPAKGNNVDTAKPIEEKDWDKEIDDIFDSGDED